MSRLHIGLFNDSFPPTIDGVAQTAKNYAEFLQKNHADVTVVTPAYKGVRDGYPFEVFRYPSLRASRRFDYRVGNPLGPETRRRLRAEEFDLLHIHAPFVSSLLAERVNRRPRVPAVLTYHTKFDVDISRWIRPPGMRRAAMRFVLENINAADEVWVVSEGCGRALRDIGYRGGYRVMENGTDFPFGRAPETAVEALRERYGIPADAFVFLYVGRMMWYKNLRLILDALCLLRKEGPPFRALLVGDGPEAAAVRAYAADCGLEACAIFPGAVADRGLLRVYYSLADVFLFPSTYDTSGIVVKEAAACCCPSLLIRGSCAAERAEHGVSAFLAEETAASCARTLADACRDRERLAAVGRGAGERLYLSWEEAVARAYARYTAILDKWPGPLPYNARAAWF